MAEKEESREALATLCRTTAEEAVAFAAESSRAVRDNYLKFANIWRALAAESLHDDWRHPPPNLSTRTIDSVPRRPLEFGVNLRGPAAMPLSVFKAEDWLLLTHIQRVEQCRCMAEEARRLGINSTGEIKHAYIKLAANWDRLANEIEKSIYLDLL